MVDPQRLRVELVVQVPTGQEFRRLLTEGQPVRIGRAPVDGWAIVGDRSISREHADVCWADGRLSVTCLPSAANSIQWRGKTVRAVTVGPLDTFEIGQTRFQIAVTEAAPAPSASAGEVPDDDEEFLTLDESDFIKEYAYKSSELERVAFGDTERQMEALSNLPRLIAASQTDVDLAVMLCGLLLEAIPPASAVAVTMFDEDDVAAMLNELDPNAPIPKPKLLRVQTRENYTGRFTPSRRLLRLALRQGESVMHIVGEGNATQFTMAMSLDWAFCAPITAESCAGWCLYVSGSGGRDNRGLATRESLKGDLRFTQLVAQLIGSIRTVRTLQEQATQLSSFFSPKVIANLTRKEGARDVLAPSERDITVLFCDVRGFSRKSEQLQDNLHQLLECMKAALGAMTGGILAFDGAIADFQGDAALGFWGWPTPLPDGPISACRAALTIMRAFNRPAAEQGLLAGFTCGVGIAHGRAIAGQIGTPQQAKIGVFGPVVNQGARIEGLTRQFGVSICMDETTADFVRRMLPAAEGRCRRLARVRPKGMDTPVLVHELLPAADDGGSLPATVIAHYETALDAVLAGQWDAARAQLAKVPDDDGPKQFLLAQMARFDNRPPSDWDGAFSLDVK